MYQFEEGETSINFANVITLFGPNTLKIGVRVYNWPFMALTNELAIVLDAKVSGEIEREKDECLNESVNEDGSLRWIMVMVDNVSLYPSNYNNPLIILLIIIKIWTVY